ncbi:MAG: hemerythrin domain-containing protein [Candidatus Staskawiczbacteria bacterium]|nr:hemerythrin domain-containing protein [Candidatus Staskawiczbacteria bacterium]
MKKPTTILSEEHQHILKVLSALSRECDNLKSGGSKLNKEFFSKAIDFIRNYADKFHHVKEEDILFKELSKDTVEMHCNPMDQMLYEHDLGRGFVSLMEEGMKENNKEKVLENAYNYVQLLQGHIFKEDNILYPMADEALSEASQKSILELFSKAEKEKFQEGARAKYLLLADELQKMI